MKIIQGNKLLEGLRLDIYKPKRPERGKKGINMRIYLKDESRWLGVKLIGYALLPELKGQVLSLDAYTRPDYRINVEPSEVALETKNFYVEKVANGVSHHSGYHRAIVLTDEGDVEKYFTGVAELSNSQTVEDE